MCVLVALIVLSAGVYADNFRIDIPLPSRSVHAGQALYTIEDFGSTTDFYMPNVPAKTFYYEIPKGAKSIKVSPVSISSEFIAIEESMFELQPPMPANKDKDYKKPRRNSHNLERFPQDYYIYNGIKVLGEHHLVSITVFPLHYYFSDHRVEYTSSYEFEISYKGAGKAKKREDATADLASEIITNIDEPEPFAAAAFTPAAGDTIGTAEVKYAIITTSNLSGALTPLRDWKREKGVFAQIYTTAEIYANYSGSDNQEKIRNFLIDLESSEDVDWVLLAGDDADVPARDVYCYDGYAGYGDFLPFFYYYADLEGS
jgi:hypothetical protein